MGNVGKQIIPHGFNQGFRSLGVINAETILACHLKRRDDHDRQGHQPQILSQIGKTANAVNKIHNKGRKIPFLTADGAIHCGADDLRLQHIRQRGHRRRQNRHQKIPLRSPQKLPQQLQFFLILAFCILCEHTHFSFSQNCLQNAKRAQAEACALWYHTGRIDLPCPCRSQASNILMAVTNNDQHTLSSFLSKFYGHDSTRISDCQ